MVIANCSGKSELMRAVLEEQARTLSYQTGFVKRESKLTGSKFAQILVVGSLHKGQATLNDLAQWASQVGVDISESGFHQRFTEAASDFMWAVLQASLEVWHSQQGLPVELLEQFSQVNILDSTHIGLPSHLASYFAGSTASQPAVVKVQLHLDYLHGRVNGLEVVAGRSPDQNCELLVSQARPHSLSLFDLGYFKKSVFADLDARQAYFVSRLHSQVNLFADPHSDQAFDLLVALQHTPTVCQTHCLYLGREDRLPVRVLAIPLPAEVVEERRRQAHQKAHRQGKTCSHHHLDWLGWHILFTNLPPHLVSEDQLVLLYRLRWQIELLFKLCKSYLGVDHMGQWHIWRTLCHLYAHLIALVLFLWLTAPYRLSDLGELSPPKAFRVLQHHASRLFTVIAHHWQGLHQLLDQLGRQVLQFALKVELPQ